MDTTLAESLVELWNTNRSDPRKPVAKRDGPTFNCGDLYIDCDGIEAAINKYVLQICLPPHPLGSIVENRDSLGSALGALAREAMVLHEYWTTTYRILRELSDLANRNGLSQQLKDRSEIPANWPSIGDILSRWRTDKYIAEQEMLLDIAERSN